MSLGFGKVVSVFLAFLRSIRGETAVVEAKKAKGYHRNQTMRNKFFAQKEKIKESHPHISEWFDSESSRTIQTEIIEQCFSKKGREWVLDLEKPFFKESKTRCVSSMEAYIEL